MSLVVAIKSVFTPVLHRAETPLDLSTEWITPAEQLKRLWLPIAEEISSLKLLVRDIEQLIAEYALDESVTNWYTALDRLKALPKQIPPLPNNIYQILESECPIYGDPTKKVKDTHFLSLVPQEFDTINQFESSILRPYEKSKCSKGTLRCRYVQSETSEHANTPFIKTHWVLMTKEALPKSENKTWDEQAELVNDLNVKTRLNYKPPTLQQIVVGIITHRVATGEMLYEVTNTNHITYTRVQELTLGFHLFVGGVTSDDIEVLTYNFFLNEAAIGVAALRVF